MGEHPAGLGVGLPRCITFCVECGIENPNALRYEQSTETADELNWRANLKPCMKISTVTLTLLLLAATILVLVLVRVQSRSAEGELTNAGAVAETDSRLAQPALLPPPPFETNTTFRDLSSIVEVAVERPAITTNKLERLTQIRETFRLRAAGDKLEAMRAAKQLVDDNERETALLTLVTEWTQGDLASPQLRAERIGRVGLEAALGMELAKHPALALLWADEMTQGDGRANVLQVTARFLVDSDPAAAFALAEQFPESSRRGFSDAIFAHWASHDTDAALNWAQQYPDAAERDAAIQAIRTSAPVGIGTALGMQDGYPVIMDLVPGMPAERSGQLNKGDRIVAIAQAGGSFMDLNELPLQNVVEAIRGAPNTMLQLKVIPSGAAPNTAPKTVIIVRDQVKFKK